MCSVCHMIPEDRPIIHFDARTCCLNLEFLAIVGMLIHHCAVAQKTEVFYYLPGLTATVTHSWGLSSFTIPCT